MNATGQTQTSKQTTPMDALEQAHVGTEMNTGVVGCTPDETILTVARRMAIYHTHCVVIAAAGERGGAWELLSHEQVVRALVAGRHAEAAGGLAAGKAVTCDAHEPVLGAARRMLAAGSDHVVVVDGDEPVGVLSTLDVMRVAAR